MLKKLLILLVGVVALILVALVAAVKMLPDLVGEGLNPVKSEEPLVVSDRARALHSTLFIADLHAETLLWKRDLLARSTWGQVDLPRLGEGNVAWQNFAVVTRTPRGIAPERNEVGPDQVAILALTGLWPTETWRHLPERALYQAELLRDAAVRSSGRLVLIRDRADIENFLARRRTDPKVVAGMLGLVGGYPLGPGAENLDRLYDAGYRMIGLTTAGDESPERYTNFTPEGRLTEAGLALVRRSGEKRMLFDLAYHPPALIDEVAAASSRPIIVSNTGAREFCQAGRALDDSRLKTIAASRGLVGIGFSSSVICGGGPTDIALSIRYAVDLIGADHVALGSGFDSVGTMPFDSGNLVRLTEALLRKGLTEDQIRKVMGGNVLRFYRENLP
ncbi:MAG: dipeptidase [Blastocatellia bacterium]